MALFSKLGALAALGIALFSISSTIVALFQVGDLAAMACGLPVLGVLCPVAISLYTKISKVSFREFLIWRIVYFISAVLLILMERVSTAVLAAFSSPSMVFLLHAVPGVNWMIDPLFRIIQHVSIKTGLPCPFIITGKTILVYMAEGAQRDLIYILNEQRPAMTIKLDDRYQLRPITRDSTPSHIDLFLYVASDVVLHDHDTLTQQTRAAYLAAKDFKPVDAFVVVGKEKEMRRYVGLGLGPACLLLPRRLKRQLDNLGYRLYCFKDRSPPGFINALAPDAPAPDAPAAQAPVPEAPDAPAPHAPAPEVPAAQAPAPEAPDAQALPAPAPAGPAPGVYIPPHRANRW
ncbi:hypothetical protein SELMODRAFT_430920 [Selaginella moellendorffii]|uniref:Uncharacterized protein n=1 Tax=Selaginella moellendorffii TaxID=88036 RepID=D8TAY8_SELML|nr:hypothetical protein SELMODRAFT_430920 [Selaginella moellendorffii]